MTLVFFTTLAPSGVAAFIILSIILVFGALTEQQREHINKILWLPLAIALLGLVASATHLGNPANALYVFIGLGRSPLSNEVFAAVIFFFISGSYWIKLLTSRKQHLVLERLWLLVAAVMGLLFILTIAFAYAVPTIVSWYSVFVPINVCLNALVGGSLLALLSLRVAKVGLLLKQAGKALCCLCGLAISANAVSMSLQWNELNQLEHSWTATQELLAYYPLIIVLFAALGVIALGLCVLSLRKADAPSLAKLCIACVLVFVGIFATRFAFYAMHMTTGISF
jgi:anaerobic dimethyl sulfoxide reductase subunit C (anchor subunit)